MNHLVSGGWVCSIIVLLVTENWREQRLHCHLWARPATGAQEVLPHLGQTNPAG